MRASILAAIVLTLSGCAPLTITPISPGEAKALHGRGSQRPGYVIYAPVQVISVAADASGACTIGTAFLLPDYSSPYLLRHHATLGSSETSVTLTNGWLLSSIDMEQDNSAVFSAIAEKFHVTTVAGLHARPAICGRPGLYRWVPGKGGTGRLEPLTL